MFNLTNILNILTPYNLGVQPLYQTLFQVGVDYTLSLQILMKADSNVVSEAH